MTRVPTVRYVAAASVRNRWRSLLGLVALVALLGGIAMGSIAAARRTESAFPTYLAASRSTNLQVSIYNLTSNTGATSSKGITASLGKLAGVAHVATSPDIFLWPRGPASSPVVRAFTTGAVQTVGSVGGESFQVDRPVVIQGRMADPSQPDEIVVSRDAAALLHWRVGERIPVDVYTLRQVSAAPVFPPHTTPFDRLTVEVVGIVVFANEVAHDDVDRFPTDVLATPALTHRLASAVGVTSYELSLRDGVAGVPAVEEAILGQLPAGSVYQFHVTSVVEGEVQRAVRPEVIALLAFGAIAAAAALVLSAQALRREVGAARAELAVVRALGADRATLALASAIGPIAATSLGAVVAGCLAVAISPVAPFDPVRLIDPSPGFSPDWTVLLAGCLGFAVLLALFGTVFAASLARGLGAPVTRAARRSRISESAAAAGLPVPIVAGLRFALEPGSGRTVVPVRSALVASAIAVAVAITTVTFGSSLSTLTSHPALYGWDWSDAIISPEGSSVPPVVRARLHTDPLVASWTGFGYANAQIEGVTVPILISSPRSPFGPTLIAGHEVEGPDQVVLGPETMASLHKSLGGTVVASYGTPADEPVYVPPTRLTIVGVATMPAIGPTLTLHTSMGVGAVLSQGIEPSAFQHAITQPDPNLNGPQFVAVRFRAGVSGSAGLGSLHAIAADATRVVARDPRASGESFIAIGPQRPAEIAAYEATGAVPVLLASGLAAGAVAALGLALAASVRRRRRDLAMLKTLGLLRRQLAFAVGWQATAVALIGVVFGVPIGIALGRWLWDAFATTIAAAPDPTVPVGTVVAIVVATVVLANLVAALPGRVAARTPAALVLRSE